MNGWKAMGLAGVLAALGWRQSEVSPESCCKMPLVVIAAADRDQLNGQPRGQEQIPGVLKAGPFEP